VDEDIEKAFDRRVAQERRMSELEGRVTAVEHSTQRIELNTIAIFEKMDAKALRDEEDRKTTIRSIIGATITIVLALAGTIVSLMLLIPHPPVH
jgi:hypothetical protein